MIFLRVLEVRPSPAKEMRCNKMISRQDWNWEKRGASGFDYENRYGSKGVCRTVQEYKRPWTAAVGLGNERRMGKHLRYTRHTCTSDVYLSRITLKRLLCCCYAKAVHYFKLKAIDVCRKEEKPRHFLCSGPGKKTSHFCTYTLCLIGLEKPIANEL